MILIGQYDSPFVRRVGIALRLYGLAFEHRPWSAFGDAEAIRRLSPLGRVPVLVLEGGFVIADSHMMLDHLDAEVAVPLFPRQGPARRAALGIAALACGIADKAVALFYERRMHAEISAEYDARCRAQILSGVAVLEADLASEPRSHWFCGTLGHADIAVTCALRFVRDAHPGLVPAAQFPQLMAYVQGHENTAIFQEISQPFIAPA